MHIANFKIYIMVVCFLCAVNFSESVRRLYRISRHTSKQNSQTLSAILMDCSQSADPNCERFMKVNIYVNPLMQIGNMKKYFILDEVFDHKQHRIVDIMSPYLIEITRGEPILIKSEQFSQNYCIKQGSSDKVNRLARSLRSEASKEHGNTWKHPSHYFHDFNNNFSANPKRNAKCDEQPPSAEVEHKLVNSSTNVGNPKLNPKPVISISNTRVQVFRRRSCAWWKVVPTVILTSLSNSNENGRLSIFFASEVNVFIANKTLVPQNNKEIVSEVKSRKEKPLIFNNCQKADDTKPTNQFKETDTAPNWDDEDILGKCLQDSSCMYFNLIDTATPAFRIRLNFPFRQNALVWDNNLVRIKSIFTDASNRGFISILVILISDTLYSADYTISIANCPLSCGKANAIKTTLNPYTAGRVVFAFPVQENNFTGTHECDVQVHNDVNEIVTKMVMHVRVMSRSISYPNCPCFHINEPVASNEVYECEALNKIKGKKTQTKESSKETFPWDLILRVVLFLILLMLLLGLLKAICGCCSTAIGSWYYDYVQPMNEYEIASRCQRFFINLIFFLVLPFICCCNRFTADDASNLNSDYGLDFVQKPYDESDEESILNQTLVKDGEESQDEDDPNRKKAGTDVEPFLAEYLWTLQNDCEEQKRDTNYILSSLSQSRIFLKEINGLSSEEINCEAIKMVRANQLVNELCEMKIVYRILNQPIGNCMVDPGQKYSIRGYFLPLTEPGYQFITYNPLCQHWRICPQTKKLYPFIPPRSLVSRDFSRYYDSKLSVLEANDLTIKVSSKAPCLNVLVQNTTMYTPTSEEEVK